MHGSAELCRNSDLFDLAQAVENVANVIGLHGCRYRLKPSERSDAPVGFGDEKRIERVQLLRPEAGQKGMSGLLSGSRPSGDSRTLHCRYRRNQDPRLEQRIDHAGCDDDTLVRRPSGLGGRIDHEGYIGSCCAAKPKRRREFAGMIRHGLFPARIIGERLSRDIELLGDEGHQFFRKSCGAVEDLRQRHGRVAKQRELQGGTEAITVLPSQLDQIEVGGFQGIEPGKVVSVRRYSNQLFPLCLG